MDSLPDPPTPSLDSVLSVRTVGTTRLPHRGIIVDLTLLLSTQPELRHGSCLVHLGALRITSWHPVVHDGAWTFPVNVADARPTA